MELSIFLAKVLGLYLVIVPSAVLLNRKQLPRLIEEFSTNLALSILSGFIALVLGLLLVVSHNVWSADWRIIITILGWLSLAKGGLRLFFPEKIQSLATISARPWWTVVLVMFLVVGAYLSFVGFSATTSPQ
jgi:ABC-type amino acid transport system permease subunit